MYRLLRLFPAHILLVSLFTMNMLCAKRLLVLIIASHDQPVYTELEQLWRLYMNSAPDTIDAYFIKADPHLETKYKIDQATNTVWLQTQENLVPGIINKTIMSLEIFFEHNSHAYDYVLRTNLSSFYMYPRLLAYLDSLPGKSVYAGSLMSDGGDGLYFFSGYSDGTPGMASGCGVIFSADVAGLILKNNYFFINNTSLTDDLLLGRFLYACKIPWTNHPRMNFRSLEGFYGHRYLIPETIFQCRIKNFKDELRATHDIPIYRELVRQFYPEL